jgi:hypothetical protein
MSMEFNKNASQMNTMSQDLETYGPLISNPTELEEAIKQLEMMMAEAVVLRDDLDKCRKL